MYLIFFLMKKHVVRKIKAAHLIPVSVSHMERRAQKKGGLNKFNQHKGGFFKIKVSLDWLGIC